MSLEEFYKKYILHKKKKEFSHLTKKEKDDLQTIYRMWDKKLVHLEEGNDNDDFGRS